MKYDLAKYPNVSEGIQYAHDVVSGKIPNSIYIIGACKRFLKDLKDSEDKDSKYVFDIEYAERYLRLVQNFEHVIGKWDTNKILYNPWQKWLWAAALGFKFRSNTSWPKYRTLHTEIPRGCAKPFSLDTEVPTPTGIKKWKDIEVGSELFDRNGDVCRVVRKNKIFKNTQTQKIIFSDGTEIITGLDHEWFTSDKIERERLFNHTKRPPKYLSAIKKYESVRTTEEIKKTLKKGKENNHSVRVCSPIKGVKKELPIPPYFLGFWLGDGSKGASRVTSDLKDIEDLSKAFNDLGIDHTIVNYRNDGSRCINPKNIFVKLRENNLLDNKHIPNSYITSDFEDRLNLLRGLIDSDGTIDKIGRVTITVGIKSLWNDLEYLISSLGFKVTWEEFKIHQNNNFKSENVFRRFSFTPRGIDFPISLLSRKLEKQINSKGTHTYTKSRFIIDVVDVEPEEMFCVEVDSPDHSFLITRRCIPTHNSTMASQCALYFIGLDPSRSGEKLACFATKNEQSKIILEAAMAMANKSPKYLKTTGVEVQAHRILDRKNFSEMVAMSSDSKSMDGLNLRIAFCDELHAMSKALFDVIVSGQKKRRDSLTICLTTAGFSIAGVGYSQSQYAKKVALGEVIDESFFSAVYTIDEGDDIYDERTWKKANPNYGYSVDPVAFASTAQKVRVNPSDKANFLVKSLNVWLSEANAYFSMAAWDSCKIPDLDIRHFLGKKCYMGIDLASKIDLTAKVLVFKENGNYYVFQKAYLPEDTHRAEDSSLYTDCESELIVTPGEAINYGFIENEILVDSRNFKISACHYDPWAATQLAQNLSSKVNMVEFKMNVGNMSEAMKTLDALIRQRKIFHNGGNLLKWCMSNVVAKEDHNRNVYPRKSSDKLKIDLAVALIMAIAGYISQEETTSVYESRGIRTI